MGFHRFKPMPSGRMGIFWTLSPIREAAVVEFGCMGHNLYGGAAIKRGGIFEGYGAPLYTTYMDETDISLGDMSRLDATIAQVIRTDHPKVIFLQPSAVPEVIGVDLFAWCEAARHNYPDVQLIPIGHGSFAISQHRGVQEALLALVEALAVESSPPKTLADNNNNNNAHTYNIIGSCPDLYNFAADSAEIIRMMHGAFHMAPCCVLSSGASATDIMHMGSARVNLVLRREGIPAAKLLQTRFGAPYVFARPYGIKGTTNWLGEVGLALEQALDKFFIESEQSLALKQIDYAYDYLEDNEWAYPEEAVLTLGGHIDVVKGILSYATAELPLRKGVCWCDCPEMADDDVPYFSENEWIPVVQNHTKGYLMFSGEALRWAKKNTHLQISNPGIAWQLHPYDPPFVGYRGAVHLVNLWINEYVLTH